MRLGTIKKSVVRPIILLVCVASLIQGSHCVGNYFKKIEDAKILEQHLGNKNPFLTTMRKEEDKNSRVIYLETAIGEKQRIGELRKNYEGVVELYFEDTDYETGLRLLKEALKTKERDYYKVIEEAYQLNVSKFTKKYPHIRVTEYETTNFQNVFVFKGEKTDRHGYEFMARFDEYNIIGVRIDTSGINGYIEIKSGERKKIELDNPNIQEIFKRVEKELPYI